MPAIDRAVEGIPGPTALHLCFGYTHVARDKPHDYAFLPELTKSKVEQILIEAAQPNLNLATLDGLGDETLIFGIVSMGDLTRRCRRLSPPASARHWVDGSG